MIVSFSLTQTMKYILLNNPTNDLSNFGVAKTRFRSSRSDADEDDCGHEFEENSGRSSSLEFDQGVLDNSATSLDMSVRFIDTGTESLDSSSAFECESFLEKDISPLK